MAANVAKRFCRKIFIGDVHGCFDELQLLLQRLNHDSKRDELYFVGDLVVKGPKSERVVDFVRNTNQTYSVMGNHDYEALRVAVDIKDTLNATIKSKIPKFTFSKYIHRIPQSLPSHMDCVNSLSAESIEYLSSMPLYLSAHCNICVVHAGLIPNVDLSEQSAWDLMHIRNVIEKPTPKHNDLIVNGKKATPRKQYEATGYHDLGNAWADLYHGPKHVFYGHDAKKKLQIGPFVTGLDTGAVYGGSLTCAVIKCDENSEELMSFDQSGGNAEDWEKDSKYVASGAGFGYWLLSQKALETYQNPYKPISTKLR